MMLWLDFLISDGLVVILLIMLKLLSFVIVFIFVVFIKNFIMCVLIGLVFMGWFRVVFCLFY